MQQLRPNTTLQGGKYKIEKHLASGGFGNTYAAINTEFDEKVAIKEFFMKDTMERDESTSGVSVSRSDYYTIFSEQKEKFKKEARRLRKLHNDHIVRVHDLFEENGTAYYVMDYIDGEDLFKRMKRLGKPLSEKEVMDILPQILDALKCVHNEGLWHLDMKPSNIMMDNSGRIWLIDFGASKQLNAQTGGAYATSNVASTDRYAPLEQVEKSYDKMGAWTDIYSLGATLYSLLTNSTPPSSSDINDDLSSDKSEAFVMPSIVSKNMRNLIVWMMNPNRKRRPQSIDEVKNALSFDYDKHTQMTNDNRTEYAVYAMEKQNETTIIVNSEKSKAESPLRQQNSTEDSEHSDSNKIIWIVLAVVGIIAVLVFVTQLNNNSETETTYEPTTTQVETPMNQTVATPSETETATTQTETYSTLHKTPVEPTNLESGYIKQEGGYTNIRQSPNGEIVMKIQDGSPILYKRSYESWYVVYNTSREKLGYVHSSKIVAEVSHNDNLSDMTSGYIKQEGGYTNIRQSPNGEIVMKIQDGSPILYKRTNSSWYVVYDTSGKRLGYVHSSKIVD